MIRQPTDEQSKIIKYKGNIVVTAKPGSGKTYTIVEKMAELIPELALYKGIIAISFTNKASDELKNRCKKRCADTKQSFFGTIDRFYISQIITPFASHITGKIADFKVVEEVEEGSAYSALLSHQGDFSEAEYELLIKGLSEGKIFLKYTGETARYILEHVSGTMKYLKARYSHIIIDEYQDCGKIQHEIFLKLVKNGLTGIAVGDINQAIYGFTNRLPEYLISLIGRDDFRHFELTKNHRCHPSISEYSLCLFGASKSVLEDKRVFKVTINGKESEIANAIDKYVERIKRKYCVTNNNQVAILCRNNSTICQIDSFLQTPHKVFGETKLDKDNSEICRFLRDLIMSCFDEKIYAVDYAEQLFSEELEPRKYIAALSLCQKIFSCSFETFDRAEKSIVKLTKMVCTEKFTDSDLKKLQSVIGDKQQLKNFIPAKENELNVMTLHKSKGLEFNIVFHLDVYRYIMPNEYGDSSSIQQDLNLHYVGITRAIDACYIMVGTERYRRKQGDYYHAEPSPFLSKPGLPERRRDVRW